MSSQHQTFPTHLLRQFPLRVALSLSVVTVVSVVGAAASPLYDHPYVFSVGQLALYWLILFLFRERFRSASAKEADESRDDTVESVLADLDLSPATVRRLTEPIQSPASRIRTMLRDLEEASSPLQPEIHRGLADFSAEWIRLLERHERDLAALRNEIAHSPLVIWEEWPLAVGTLLQELFDDAGFRVRRMPLSRDAAIALLAPQSYPSTPPTAFVTIVLRGRALMTWPEPLVVPVRTLAERPGFISSLLRRLSPDVGDEFLRDFVRVIAHAVSLTSGMSGEQRPRRS